MAVAFKSEIEDALQQTINANDVIYSHLPAQQLHTWVLSADCHAGHDEGLCGSVWKSPPPRQHAAFGDAHVAVEPLVEQHRQSTLASGTTAMAASPIVLKYL